MPTETHYRATDLDSGWEAAVLARALELAAEATGNPVSADAACRAAAGQASSAGPWTEVAASAAQQLGLQPQILTAAPSVLSRDRPALVRTGTGCWWVVVGQFGRRLRVVRLDARGETRMTLRPSAVAELAADEPWLLLQPSLALDPISARRRPALGRSPWRRLRAFLELERRELWVVLVYALVIGGLSLATPVAVQALVNTVAFGAVLQPLVVLSVLLLGGLSFAGVLSVLEAYVVEVLQRRVFVRIADDFGRRIPAIEVRTLDARFGPEVVNRFFDVLTIQKTLSVLLLDGLAVTLQTVIGMVVLGFYHPWLLTFDAVLVVMLVVVLAMGRGAVASATDESAAKYATAAWLEDVSRVPHMFRGTSAQRHAAQRTAMLSRDYLTSRKRHFRILLRQIVGGIGLQVFAVVALLGIGGWLVVDRQLTLGQLVAAELIIAVMAGGFTKLGSNLEKVYDLNVGVLKIGSIVDLPTERRGGEILTSGGAAGIVLRDVGVERGERSLLWGVDVDIAAGERVLITGEAGSGKSTLLEVMAGIRAASSGSVQVDGLDLRRADLGSVRDSVELVRGAHFVSGSVLDNIALHGRPSLDERTVRNLLRTVGLEDAIDALPEGLDTPMLPTGAPLSDRQAKRLALVRAMACRPRVLMLDGALDGLGLSHVDKDRLLEVLFGRDAPWTVVVVGDDPDVAARCGRVLRIQDSTLGVVQ